MTQLNLLTPERARLETELFDFLGLTDDLINELVSLQHDPETIEGLTQFFNAYNIWPLVENVVFCLVPFGDIRRVILKGGVVEDREDFGTIEASVHILQCGTPIMFLNKETFSLSVFKHEMVHIKQVLNGLDVRKGLSRYWMGEKKPDYFTYGRSQEEQYALPWELEAYATMYTDEDLKREHDKVLTLIKEDREPEVVEAMRLFYRMIIIPYGRKLPFEIEIL